MFSTYVDVFRRKSQANRPKEIKQSHKVLK